MVDTAERRSTLAGPLLISAPVSFRRMHLGRRTTPFSHGTPRSR